MAIANQNDQYILEVCLFYEYPLDVGSINYDILTIGRHIAWIHGEEYREEDVDDSHGANNCVFDFDDTKVTHTAMLGQDKSLFPIPRRFSTNPL